jgi:hypothetical protein
LSRSMLAQKLVSPTNTRIAPRLDNFAPLPKGSSGFPAPGANRRKEY